MTPNPRNSYIGALAAQARAEAYPWTAWRAHLGNVLPYYTELRTVHKLPAGAKTWHIATHLLRAEIEDAERRAYGY